MKILVTGVAGFIGRHVASRLIDAGHEVVGIDNFSTGFRENIPDGVDIFEGSYGSPFLLDKVFQCHQFDAAYHIGAFAAECLSPFAPTFTHQNNTVGTATLLAAAVRHKVRLFVFTSSIAVYGNQVPPFSEDTPPRPVDTYGASKLASENDIRAATERFGISHVIWRPFNVYGAYQSINDPFRNVIGIFMRNILLGRPMPIFGDGEQKRAFSHIDEVAPAIAACIDRPATWNQTYNIGGGITYTVRHLADRVAEAMGVELDVIHRPARHEVFHAFSKRDKLLKHFNDLVSPIPLSCGLEEMAEWVKATGVRDIKKFQHLEIEQGLPESWKEYIA